MLITKNYFEKYTDSETFSKLTIDKTVPLFLDKINEKAAYLAMQCDDMITLLKMTLNKALGRTRRPTNYF